MPTGKKAASSNSTRSTDARAIRVLPAERRSAGSWWASVGLTTVRSANGVEYQIRHLRHQFHPSHIVDPNDMRAAEDCRGHRSRCRVIEQRLRRLVQLR